MVSHKEFVKSLIEYTKAPNNPLTFALVTEVTKRVEPLHFLGFYERVVRKDKYGDPLKAIIQTADEYKNKGQIDAEAKMFANVLKQQGLAEDEIIQQLKIGGMIA